MTFEFNVGKKFSRIDNRGAAKLSYSPESMSTVQ
jgi:hypothetical protein